MSSFPCKLSSSRPDRFHITSLFHSDRGSQYRSHEFQKALQGYEMKSSIREPKGRLLGLSKKEIHRCLKRYIVREL